MLLYYVGYYLLTHGGVKLGTLHMLAIADSVLLYIGSMIVAAAVIYLVAWATTPGCIKELIDLIKEVNEEDALVNSETTEVGA